MLTIDFPQKVYRISKQTYSPIFNDEIELLLNLLTIYIWTHILYTR